MIPLGLDGELHIGTAGSQATAELENCKDVNITMDKATADTSRRKGQGWKSVKGTLKSLAIEFTMLDDTTDMDLATVRAAYLNNTLIALWAKDHATGEGPDADFEVTQFSRDESLTEAIVYKVKCEASDENRAPTWS